MNFFRALTMLVLFVSATSIAEPDKKAPPPAGDATAPPAADVQKWIAFFDKLVDIVIANKDDCTKMAAAITAHIDANKDLLDKARVAASSGKQLPKAAQDHMMESTKRMMGAMQKCGKDEQVRAAFQRVDMKH